MTVKYLVPHTYVLVGTYNVIYCKSFGLFSKTHNIDLYQIMFQILFKIYNARIVHTCTKYPVLVIEFWSKYRIPQSRFLLSCVKDDRSTHAMYLIWNTLKVRNGMIIYMIGQFKSQVDGILFNQYTKQFWFSLFQMCRIL